MDKWICLVHMSLCFFKQKMAKKHGKYELNTV